MMSPKSLWPFQRSSVKSVPKVDTATTGLNSQAVAVTHLLEAPGDYDGIEVSGQPGKDCHLGLLSEEGIGKAKVVVRFVGGKQHDHVSIVLGKLNAGKVAILVHGSDVQVKIGCSKLMNVHVPIGPNAALMIGDHTTCQNTFIAVKHGQITIGEDCMISGQVNIDAAMHHAVVDLSASEPRIENDPRHLKVGEHVWIGNGAALIGNCEVGSGAIIGRSAIVGGKVPARTVSVGNPARVIRTDVTWTRVPHDIDPKAQSYIESHVEAAAASSKMSGTSSAAHVISEGNNP